MAEFYAPDQVDASLGGQILEGYADGAMISVEFPVDDYEMKVGTKGDVAVARIHNPTATVTAYATVTARPTATRTVTVSRSKPRATVSGNVAGIQSRIRQCESGGNYRAENPTSTASGAYQFLAGTWRDVTGLEPPASAYPPAVQDAAFTKLYAQLGTKPWNASRGCWS